jgi:hypothetical protein
VVAPRTLLGRHDTLFFRERVYEVQDGLEVDEYTLTTIERRRVPFEDVLAATYHRRRGPVYLAVVGFLAAGFGITAAGMMIGGQEAAIVGAVLFGPLAAVFLLAFILRVTLQVDVITVHGRRTTARLAYVYRKAEARDTFERLTRRIRERHETLAAALPPPAPPEEDLPLPPGPEPTPPPA